MPHLDWIPSAYRTLAVTPTAGQPTSVLIAGAGIAGMLAAVELARTGFAVTLVEARDRLGGRISSVSLPGSPGTAEAGAEFVHGHLPVTLSLLDEAGIRYSPFRPRFYTIRKGRFDEQHHDHDHWDELLEKLASLPHDLTLTEFLTRHFDGAEYTELRQAAIGFASGYDSADADRVSAFALRDEWMNEDEEQFRMEGGYESLVGYLRTAAEALGVTTLLRHRIDRVTWESGKITVLIGNGTKLTARAALFTLPVPMMEQLEFVPPLPEVSDAYHRIGFGQVIKFLLRFSQAFWEEKTRDTADAFFLSDEKIPTWWTAGPGDRRLLTGWLAGPKCAEYTNFSEEALLTTALESLSGIFNLPTDRLRQLLEGSSMVNWTHDPYTKGSYAYATPETAQARNLLLNGWAGTLFFAGEALYEGPAMGTVEAALCSAKYAVTQMTTALNRP